MMHRTQISLESWQYEALKALSEKKGRSLSGLLREILSRHFQGRQKSARARLRSIEGIGADATAAGKDHDRFLYGDKRPSS